MKRTENLILGAFLVLASVMLILLTVSNVKANLTHNNLAATGIYTVDESIPASVAQFAVDTIPRAVVTFVTDLTPVELLEAEVRCAPGKPAGSFVLMILDGAGAPVLITHYLCATNISTEIVGKVHAVIHINDVAYKYSGKSGSIHSWLRVGLKSA